MLSPPRLADIPAHLLHAELLRRQDAADGRPACGHKGNKGTYNTTLHVLALALILALSTAGPLPPLFPPSKPAPSDMPLTRILSLLLPHCRQALPLDPRPPSVPLHLAALWHRRPHSHRLRPPPAHRLRVAHRSMSSPLLEQALSSHARPRRHDGRLRRRRH